MRTPWRQFLSHLMAYLSLLCAGLAWAAPPVRIVSLDLCTDWLLAHHASASHDVVLSPFVQRYPWPNGALPWPGHDGSLEQVMALKPDVVLVGAFNAMLLRQRLQSLGVRVVVLPLPQTWGEVGALSATVQTLLGQARPAELATTALGHSRSSPQGRLLLLGANGYGVGRDTLEDSLLTHAGWANYVQASGHVPLDLEALAARPPDAIVWSAPRHAALANQFAQHPVLRRAVPRWLHTDAWRWQCPGPWMQALLAQLQP